MKLVVTSRFKRQYKKITFKNKLLADRVTKALELFIENTSHPSLRLHKLSGSSYYSLSVTMNIRIILAIEDTISYLLEIGTHDDVY